MQYRIHVHGTRQSDGGTVAIPEAEIARALEQLCARGLFAEPTSATAAAAYTALLAEGRIAPGEATAVVLTGTWLKAAATVSELLDGIRQ